MGNGCTSGPAPKDSQRSRILEERTKYVDNLLNSSGDEPVGNGHDTVDGTKPKSMHESTEKNLPYLNPTDAVAVSVEPLNYDFDIENLVFEGGGYKGIAYCGAMKYLQELGILEKIKRIVGTSAGAMTASLTAIGYTSDEIFHFLTGPINEVFMDHSFGYCSLLPNLISSYGWNPGKKIHQWFGDRFMEKTGKADVTFRELYKLTGIELCIVVTNLTQMSTEYCHLKTTPDMPVRLAVRMSLSIPGIFSAVKYKDNGETNVYVDGGLLCNYAIHCFDGWFLSLKPGDSFIQRLQPLSELPCLFEKTQRFGTYNPKTLGFLVFANDEVDVYKYILERRIGVLSPEKPSKNTKAYTESMSRNCKEEKIKGEHGRVVNAVNTFLAVLKKHDLDKNDTLTRSELETALKDEDFTEAEKVLLFGPDADANTTFDRLDVNKDDEISYFELIEFIQSIGVSLQARFLGYRGKEVKNFISFLDSLQSTLLTNVKRVYVNEHDMDRTVGINTGHIGTVSLDLEDEDLDFVAARGYNATRTYFQYYVAINNTKPKEKSMDFKSPRQG